MLFHYELGFPEMATLRFGTLRLAWTQHALRECKSDRYGIVHPPDTLDTETAQVIEAEIHKTPSGALETTKVVYRIPYTQTKDMVLVVIPSSSRVKTVWINVRDDTHRTLDASKYCRPEELQ
jgi:hypothetical protein